MKSFQNLQKVRESQLFEICCLCKVLIALLFTALDSVFLVSSVTMLPLIRNPTQIIKSKTFTQLFYRSQGANTQKGSGNDFCFLVFLNGKIPRDFARHVSKYQIGEGCKLNVVI